MKMEQIECSETSAYNTQTPGKYPKEYIQDSKHGESLKSRIFTHMFLPLMGKRLAFYLEVLRKTLLVVSSQMVYFGT